MNIFYLDDDMDKCVQYHCDKHVVKMILESAQMLSTVCNGFGFDTKYKPVHQRHPCTLWVANSLSNFRWLYEFTFRLHEEWRYRYGHPATKTHKSIEAIRLLPSDPPIPDLGITDRPKCVTDPFRNLPVVEAYREYYKADKAYMCTWKNRPVPEWFNANS
jgi:hypothetical protein